MKKSFSILIALGLIGSALMAPALGQEEAPTAIPEVVQIDDPLNDANGMNDQGNRGQTGFQGDHVTPADGGSVSDMLKIWFSHDVENVSVHIQTQAAGPASTAIMYEVFSNPGGDFSLGCLRWVGLIPGAGATSPWQGPPVIKLIDRCNDEGTNLFANGVEGEYKIETLPDETGLLTLTFPRSYSPLLVDDLPIATPFAEASLAFGADGAGVATPVTVDNTVDGTDYILTAAEEPAKPPVKKGCKKGSPKAKKKGCKK